VIVAEAARFRDEKSNARVWTWPVFIEQGVWRRSFWKSMPLLMAKLAEQETRAWQADLYHRRIEAA
jgi:hypothetical protein